MTENRIGGLGGLGGFRPPRPHTPVGAPGFTEALKRADRQSEGEALARPVPGQIVKGFDLDHPGIDFQAAPGTPVVAAHEGIVESSGWAGGYGNLLVVRHNQNERAYYAHLSEMEVLPGQRIERGQEIARSGNTGQISQPHLHFELRESGQAVDPGARLENL